MKFIRTALLPLIFFHFHNRSNFQFWKVALALTTAFYMTPDLDGHIGDEKGRGMNPLSEEAIKGAEENWHAVVDVKPNKVGLERIKNHREANDLPPLFLSAASHGEEFVVVKGQQNAVEYEAVETNTSLPSSVDNSKLPSFPPIGDQQQLGSCVAWGTTYYQATHEYGLLNGLNNKISFEHVFSPKWTYNNLNGGVDEGLNIFETYQLFSQNGLVTIDRLPYDTDYRAWDLNAEDWVSAISYRLTPGHLIAGIGGDRQNLQVIKQILNNGHVLTFGTFIDSWQMTKVKNDPSTSNNPHAGELAAAWMNGTDGGHCMTIVGYDDNIWIDVNNNGKVDPGEKGAFLVANSWSEAWGNKGFVWIAYDAFLTQSAVPHGPWLNRVGIAAAMNSYVVSAVPIAHNYSPKMVAQFSLSQKERDQISVSVGVSDTKSQTPTHVFNSYAVVNKGGDLDFDGTAPKVVQTATFALDLTDLLSEVSSANKRFYLLVKDKKKGNPTIIQSFKIIDNDHNKTVVCSNDPINKTDTSRMLFIDYDPAAPAPPYITSILSDPPSPIKPNLTITSPVDNENAFIYLWLSANAYDIKGVERVEFYIDSELYATEKTAPYYALLWMDKLAYGTHELTVIAYNHRGNYTSKSVYFRVREVFDDNDD